MLWAVVLAHLAGLCCSCARPSDDLVKRWGLLEPPFAKNTLAVPVPIPRGRMYVLISHDERPESGYGVTLCSASGEPIFHYVEKGTFGVPEADYGSGLEPPRGRDVIDLNTDGQFDVMVTWEEKQMYVFFTGRWVKVQGRKGGLLRGPVGEDGTEYRFEAASGRWIASKPATRPSPG